MRAYIKVFFDLLDAIEPLDDSERGRLLTAMLIYGKSGSVDALSGNERFVFPVVKAQIDRDKESYEKVSAARRYAGSRGALANASKCQQMLANADKREQMPANASKCSQEKEKDKEKEEEKDKDKEKDNDKEKELLTSPKGEVKRARKKFTAPSVEEVEAYCNERRNGISAELFVDYYSARGWMMGKELMEDWKAAVRIWEQRQAESKQEVDRQAWMDEYI